MVCVCCASNCCQRLQFTTYEITIAGVPGNCVNANGTYVGTLNSPTIDSDTLFIFASCQQANNLAVALFRGRVTIGCDGAATAPGSFVCAQVYVRGDLGGALLPVPFEYHEVSCETDPLPSDANYTLPFFVQSGPVSCGGNEYMSGVSVNVRVF